VSVTDNVSDGHHTFGELYEHRFALFLALCRTIAKAHPDRVWRAKRHFDGSSYPGWFIMGIHRHVGEQITYHLPLRLWDDAEFAFELDPAPPWDGHTPDDVLARLDRL
jgi:hypothetical protein